MPLKCTISFIRNLHTNNQADRVHKNFFYFLYNFQNISAEIPSQLYTDFSRKDLMCEFVRCELCEITPDMPRTREEDNSLKGRMKAWASENLSGLIEELGRGHLPARRRDLIPST